MEDCLAMVRNPYIRRGITWSNFDDSAPGMHEFFAKFFWSSRHLIVQLSWDGQYITSPMGRFCLPALYQEWLLELRTFNEYLKSDWYPAPEEEEEDEGVDIRPARFY